MLYLKLYYNIDHPIYIKIYLFLYIYSKDTRKEQLSPFTSRKQKQKEVKELAEGNGAQNNVDECQDGSLASRTSIPFLCPVPDLLPQCWKVLVLLSPTGR